MHSQISYTKNRQSIHKLSNLLLLKKITFADVIITAPVNLTILIAGHRASSKTKYDLKTADQCSVIPDNKNKCINADRKIMVTIINCVTGRGGLKLNPSKVFKREKGVRNMPEGLNLPPPQLPLIFTLIIFIIGIIYLFWVSF